MANQLAVAKVLSIKTLHEQGWSQRRIARELGVSRQAVANHVQELSNPAKAPTGSDHADHDSNLAKAPTGSRSLCAAFHELILAKLEQGLSAERIFRDLVDDHGFPAKYPSVRRYVAKLKAAQPLPFRRIDVRVR